MLQEDVRKCLPVWQFPCPWPRSGGSESVFRGDERRCEYVLRPIVDPVLESTVSIATHSARTLSPLAAGVISLVKEIVVTGSNFSEDH